MRIIITLFLFLLSITFVHSNTLLNIIGDFNTVEVVSSNDKYVFTNLNKGHEKTNLISIENGINIISIAPEIDLYNWYFNQDEMNHVFIINNKTSSNTYINLRDFSSKHFSHFYLSAGIENFPSKDYFMFEMEFGGRFVISDSEKIKIGINRSMQMFFSDHIYNGYIESTFGITLGYNIGIYQPKLSKEYLFSWFSDFLLKIPDNFSIPYRMNLRTGINIILCPLVSLNICLGINIFLSHGTPIPPPFIFKTFSSSPSIYSNPIDFCLFVSYEIFFPIKNEQKVEYINL